MKNNSFFNKNKSLIIILILFLGWAIFLYFLVLPAINSLKGNFIEVEKRKLDDKVSEEKINRLPDLKNKSELIHQDIDNLNVIFSEDRIIDLVNELEKIAESTGNDVAISVGEKNNIIESNRSKANKDVKENEFVKSLPVQNYFEVEITLNGNYRSLMKFVDKLNTIEYYNVIKYFNLIVVEEDEKAAEKSVAQNDTISLMSSGDDSTQSEKIEAVKGGIFLESKIGVLFYLLEKKDEKN